MKSASLLTSVGSLTNSSINRSPYAYEQNPDKDKYACNVCIVCVCVRMHVYVSRVLYYIHHYSYNANVDHTMFVLKMIDDNKKPLGMIRYITYHVKMATVKLYHLIPMSFSWFAVHCTSMNNTNELISSDNKGYASYLMEQSINQALPGEVGRGLLIMESIKMFFVG